MSYNEPSFSSENTKMAFSIAAPTVHALYNLQDWVLLQWLGSYVTTDF